MGLITQYPVATVCQVLNYPRSQVYYQARSLGDESEIKDEIRQLAGAHPTYGYRRITAMLKRLGYEINHKRVARLMQELGLVGKRPVKRKRTTNSNHPFQRYPNLVSKLRVDHPDQVWVADISVPQQRRERWE